MSARNLGFLSTVGILFVTAFPLDTGFAQSTSNTDDAVSKIRQQYKAMIESVPQIKSGTEKELASSLGKECGKVSVVSASGHNSEFGGWRRVALQCDEEAVIQALGGRQSWEEPILWGLMIVKKEVDTIPDVNKLYAQIKAMLIAGGFVNISTVWTPECPGCQEETETWQLKDAAK